MKTRQSTAKKWTLVVLVAFALIALISGTYARYSTQKVVNATVGVAQWAVKVNDVNDTEVTTQPVTFVVQNNTNVVPGKIAPAVTAIATLKLDLTGTEVAVDFDAAIDQSSLSSYASGDKLSLVTKLDGNAYTSGTSQTIPLVNNAAFTSSNGVKTVTLELTWTNDDANNVDDTTMGVDGGTITIPVTFTVQQHIGA